MRRLLIRALIPAAGLLVLGLLLIRICEDGGAMASAYRTCRCVGVEWRAYDRTAADGPRRTYCLGIVRSRTCYTFREGAETSCPD